MRQNLRAKLSVKLSAVSPRVRLALSVVGIVAVVAALTGPAGAGVTEANINTDANYQIGIVDSGSSVAVGSVVTWTVTFKRATATTTTAPGGLDIGASLSVVVPTSVTNVVWQCTAAAGSYCNARNGLAQLTNSSGAGSPALLPGLSLSGAPITVAVTGTMAQGGTVRVEARKHDGEGALANAGFVFSAFDDVIVSGTGSSTTTLVGATTTTSAVTTTTNPGPCYISGAIWRDDNADGIAGAEPGIGNMKVSVLTANPPWADTNGDGLPTVGETGVLAQVVTESSGNYFSPVISCGIAVRVFFGPIAGYTLTKQWTVNGLPGNPGLIAPSRQSKFAVSGVGAATAIFDSGSQGAKQIDGGLVPVLAVTTTSTIATTAATTAPVTIANVVTTTLPTVAVAPPCTGDASISLSTSAKTISLKRSKASKFTISLRSTCAGLLSVRFSATGLKLTSTGPSQGHVGSGVWAIDGYDPSGAAPSMSLSASSSTKGTKVLTMALTQAGDTNPANNTRTITFKVS